MFPLPSSAASNYEDFVRSNSPAANVVLDFERITYSKGWRFAIFGGAARDIILDGPRAQPRDLDIVVEGATQSELQKAFKLRHKTFFGGLNGKIGEVSVDLWPLQSTWAFSKMNLDHTPTFADLVHTTPFNIEAIVLEPKLFTEVHDGGFFDCMHSKVLEINLDANVQAMPALAFIRAARFRKKFDLKLGPRLQAFVDERWPTFNAKVAKTTQVGYYGSEVLTWDELSLLLTGSPSVSEQTAPKAVGT